MNYKKYDTLAQIRYNIIYVMYAKFVIKTYNEKKLDMYSDKIR
jgi:hypothetical protein